MTAATPQEWRCESCGETLLAAFGGPPSPAVCDDCAAEERRATRRRHGAAAVAGRPLAELLAAAGVPPRYAHCSRESWDPGVCSWPASADDWTGGSTVYVHGAATGSGKTHLVTALLAERLRAGESGRWWDAGELLHALRQEVAAGGDLVGECGSLAVLVLDDLGAEALTSWGASQLRLLIRWRYNRRLGTLFTSNLPLSQLRLGEPAGERRDQRDLVPDPRLVSRLLDDGLVIELSGRDERLARRGRR